MFETIARNTAAQAVGKIGTLVLSLLATGLLTRLLGEHGYGQYAFITALVLLFGNIANWGTDTIAVREASKSQDSQPVIYGNILLLRFGLAVLSVFLLILSSEFVPGWEKISTPLLIGSFVLVFLSLKTSMNIIFQTRLRYDLASLAEFLGTLVLTLLVYLVYVNHGSLEQVILVWLISTSVAAGVALYLGLKLSSLVLQFDKKTSLVLLKESLSTGALLLVYSIYNRIDILILERFKGFTDVSNYGLAYKLYDQLVLGAAFFMNAMFPYFSRAFGSKSIDEVKRYYQKSFDTLFLGGIMVVVSTYVFAPLIIEILAPGFDGAVGALRILSLAVIFAYFNHLTGYSLISFGRQKVSLLIAIIALVFNLSANYLFIPVYSYTASAIITVATEGLVLLLSSIAIYKTIGFLPSLTSWIVTVKELVRTRKINF